MTLAYILSAVWRDGLQKGLFMHPNSLYYDHIITAFKDMMINEDSRNYLVEKLGDYPMYFGEDSKIIMDSLYSYVTKKRLQALIDLASRLSLYGLILIILPIALDVGLLISLVFLFI